ncbi:hypothetical protein PHOSAC3_140068 [Mesotoga infera]|nr:hypothetical protein PHOSAC3_140068 [Mesotoga infera]
MEEERERIKKGGMKTEVRGQWPEVGRARDHLQDVSSKLQVL